jgi:hypothetical protein
MLIFYGGSYSPPTQPPVWRTTPCQLFATLIQYIHSYPPSLEAFSSICNLRMYHAVVTRNSLNVDNFTNGNKVFIFTNAQKLSSWRQRNDTKH